MSAVIVIGLVQCH